MRITELRQGEAHTPECMISEFLLLVSVPIALADSRTRTSLVCDKTFAMASPTTPAPISTVSIAISDFEEVLSRLLACAPAMFMCERAFLNKRNESSSCSNGRGILSSTYIALRMQLENPAEAGQSARHVCDRDFLLNRS